MDSEIWVAFPAKILHQWGNMHEWHILMTEGIIFNGAPMMRLIIFSISELFVQTAHLLLHENRGSHFICGRKILRLIAHLLTGWQVVKTCGSLQTERPSGRILSPADSQTWSYLPNGTAHLPSLSSSFPKNSLSSLFFFPGTISYLVSVQFLCLSPCPYLQISSHTQLSSQQSFPDGNHVGFVTVDPVHHNRRHEYKGCFVMYVTPSDPSGYDPVRPC